VPIHKAIVEEGLGKLCLVHHSNKRYRYAAECLSDCMIFDSTDEGYDYWCTAYMIMHDEQKAQPKAIARLRVMLGVAEPPVLNLFERPTPKRIDPSRPGKEPPLPPTKQPRYDPNSNMMQRHNARASVKGAMRARNQKKGQD